MNLKNTILWGAAGLVAVSAGATFAANGGVSKIAAMVRPAHVSDVTRSVANVDSGVVITLSASGADAIATLQKRELARPSRAVEVTADGVKITLTSTDATVAKQLQDSQGRMGGEGRGMMGGREGKGDRGGMMGFRPGAFGSGAALDFASVKRVVTNVDNGAVVTMTSDKADVATALQNGPAGKGPMGQDASVTVTKENVDGGVKMTITSTDAATVAKIQAREAKGGFGPGIMGGKAGFAKGGKMGGRWADTASGAQAPAKDGSAQ